MDDGGYRGDVLLMSDHEKVIADAVAWLDSHRGDIHPRVGLVLGSGLDPLIDVVDIASECSTTDIPGYPASTVEGHAGRLVFGRLAGREVVVLRGRVHGYEGYGLQQVTMPVRLLAGLAIDTLILTNAAGGLHAEWSPGDVMLIEDHLNLQGAGPLEGPNVDAWGPRFPDMSEVWDASLRESAMAAAERAGLELRRGVYAAVRGPQYETPAEVRMIARLGGDAVGMSTVPEAIVARHMGVRLLGFSVISNLAAGISPTPLDHAEVVEAGRKTGPRLAGLIRDIVGGLPA